MNESLVFSPVGRVRCANRYKFEAPRQGVYAHGATGTIELYPGHDYETALEDLSGFERIWVIFVFDRNPNWKPKVSPPVTGTQKRFGVFATRSPHRPNPIGLSCVELEKVEGLTLHIRNHDFLDGTPVLDLKPYIPEADAFPGSKAGWRETADAAALPVEFTPEALLKIAFVEKVSGLDLANFCRVQLAHNPASDERKRVEILPDGTCLIGCRTWRLRYRVEPGRVTVFDVATHYTAAELAGGTGDPYGDKAGHRRFLEEFK